MTPAQRELFKHAVFKFEPLPANFAIITAYDPNGLTTDPERDVAADEALAAELSTAGYRLHRITGGSAAGTHVEPGWGVPIGLPRAIEYGRRYRQEAVFFVQGGRVALVDCTDGSTEVFGQPFKANNLFSDVTGT